MSDRNYVWRGCRLQRPVVALAMAPMRLGIVQQGWRPLPRWDFAQEFRITLEQGIDSLNHLASNATNHPRFSGIGLRAFIKWAAGFDQALIQPRPFVVAQADHLENGEEHHLL